MSHDDKLIDVQVIFTQCGVNYDKFWGMSPMVLSDPWADSPYIIVLNPVENTRDEPNVY